MPEQNGQDKGNILDVVCSNLSTGDLELELQLCWVEEVPMSS
jgi:hypothetical protein